MPSAPLFGPTVGLQVGEPPPPSSSVKTTLVPALLKVAECQNAKFSVSRTCSVTTGCSRSEMSSRMPSPMQAPAAMSLLGYAVMSWQPLVVLEPLPPGLPPSGKSTGVPTRAASWGADTGTFTTLMLSCGGWQSGKAAFGEYDETYT